MASSNALIRAQKSAVGSRFCAVSLPLEMVAHALGYLAQADLQRASSVSRQFRLAALQAGLSIEQYLFLGYMHHDSYAVEQFLDVVHYARQYDMRIGLVLEFDRLPLPRPKMSSRLERAARQLSLIFDGLLPSLASLSVTVPNVLGPALHALLCQPAPHLRNLRIECVHPRGGEHLHIPISPHFLGGRKAKLRSVTLQGVSVGSEPVPAFEHVQHVHLSLDTIWPDILVKPHFPLVSHLHINCTVDGLPGPLRDFRLPVLELESLTIEDHSLVPITAYVEATLPLRMIPVVRHDTGFMRYNESIWRDDSANLANLSAYLRTPENSDKAISTTLIVSNSATRWRRVFDLRDDPEHRKVCPIVSMPGIQSSMTYIRLENRYLRAFVRTKSTLNALRRLRVDLCLCLTMIWSPDWCGNLSVHGGASAPFDSRGNVRVSCPSLEELTVFAMDNAPGVRPDEAAYLGRALGQMERPRDERARLSLVGVEFASGEAQSLVGQAFSSVRLRPFAGRHSAEDHEGGLWAY
ncbi:hypothetical protein AURDEDRAFT_163761 [Auricularia subglabra TFB-10046 SS5]|nr:hypothetical protein AURDEDRAFT_163761 [Auricularia subglabra TFB-10046 SS5]